MDGPTVPVVYSVSFADPAGYFLATRMQMHNKDVIFAANAQSVEITKFAQFIDTLATVPTDVADRRHQHPNVEEYNWPLG
jgi:polysaccharide biosynthesis/export protein